MTEYNHYFKLGVDSISQLYHFINYAFTINQTIYNVLFSIIIISSSYSLRQSDFSIPRYNTVTYGKHSLRYLGPRLWQRLPPDLTSAKTLNIFKSRSHKNDI